MNKKILIFGILAVLMLVSLSFATAVNTQVTRKESPLYQIRIRLAIGQRIQALKTRFISERGRLLFSPFELLKNTEEFSTRTYLEVKNFWDTIYYCKTVVSINCECSNQ